MQSIVCLPVVNVHFSFVVVVCLEWNLTKHKMLLKKNKNCHNVQVLHTALTYHLTVTCVHVQKYTAPIQTPDTKDNLWTINPQIASCSLENLVCTESDVYSSILAYFQCIVMFFS